MSNQNPNKTGSKGWAILCDARHGHDLGIATLALVDQQLDGNQWWTSDDPTIVMCYHYEYVAMQACKRFKRNNPRVVLYEDALKVVIEQNQRAIDAMVERVTA